MSWVILFLLSQIVSVVYHLPFHLRGASGKAERTSYRQRLGQFGSKQCRYGSLSALFFPLSYFFNGYLHWAKRSKKRETLEETFRKRFLYYTHSM